MLEWLKSKVKSFFEVRPEAETTVTRDESDNESVVEVAAEQEEAAVDQDASIIEQINAAVRVARSRPAPSFIQKLLARVRKLITKFKAKAANPVARIGSMFSGLVGGETGSLLNMLSVKLRAFGAAVHALKAVEAGLNLIGLIIETFKAVVSFVVAAVKSAFSAVTSFFTGCKETVVDLFTPSTTEGNAEENDHTNTLAVLGLGAIGAGLLFSNRDKLPAAKDAMNDARTKATEIATATVDGAKDLTNGAFNHAYNLFVNSPEAQSLELHRQEAVKGFTDVMNTVRNFTAEDAKLFLTHALRPRTGA